MIYAKEWTSFQLQSCKDDKSCDGNQMIEVLIYEEITTQNHFQAEFPEAYYQIKWYRNLQGWISCRKVNATVSGSSFVSWCFTEHQNKVYSQGLTVRRT